MFEQFSDLRHTPLTGGLQWYWGNAKNVKSSLGLDPPEQKETKPQNA